MWYIFKGDGKCTGFCNSEPSIDDLSTRDETAVESDIVYDICKIVLVADEIQVVSESVGDKANQIKTDYERQVVELKDALLTATLANDTETIESLKSDYATVMAEYQTALEAVNND